MVMTCSHIRNIYPALANSTVSLPSVISGLTFSSLGTIFWLPVIEIRRPAWREAVDRCQLLTSPAYHLLRRWHNLPPLPYLGQQLAYIRDNPNLAYI